MKFGKELKNHSVRGWEEYYMSYKRQKRVIKKIVIQMKEKRQREKEQKAANQKLKLEGIIQNQNQNALSVSLTNSSLSTNNNNNPVTGDVSLSLNHLLPPSSSSSSSSSSSPSSSSSSSSSPSPSLSLLVPPSTSPSLPLSSSSPTLTASVSSPKDKKKKKKTKSKKEKGKDAEKDKSPDGSGPPTPPSSSSSSSSSSLHHSSSHSQLSSKSSKDDSDDSPSLSKVENDTKLDDENDNSHDDIDMDDNDDDDIGDISESESSSDEEGGGEKKKNPLLHREEGVRASLMLPDRSDMEERKEGRAIAVLRRRNSLEKNNNKISSGNGNGNDSPIFSHNSLKFPRSLSPPNIHLALPSSTQTQADKKQSSSSSSSPSSSSSFLLPPTVSPSKSSRWVSVLLSGDAKQQFFHLFDDDLEKVNWFYKLKFEELKSKLEEWNEGMATATTTAMAHGDKEHRHSHILIHSPKSQDDSNIGFTHFHSHSQSEREESRPLIEKFSSHNNNSDSEIDTLNKHNSTLSSSSSSSSYGSVDVPHTTSFGLSRPALHRSVTDTLHSHSHSHTLAHHSVPHSFLDFPHQITVSSSIQLENRAQFIHSLYRQFLQLSSYRDLNRRGFEKIMKKYDKYAEDHQKSAQLKKVDASFFILDKNNLKEWTSKVEELYLRIAISRGLDPKSTMQMLKSLERDVDANVDAEEIQKEQKAKFRLSLSSSSSFIWVLVAAVAFGAMQYAPILSHYPRAHSCLSLLIGITVLWITEAVPYFVSSLLIPFFVVLLGILSDDAGVPLTAEKASKVVFGNMYSDATIIIIAGFAISTAVSKCQFELRLASFIQSKTGHRPQLFLLSYMFLGCFLSCFISNIAAPVLISSILLPHLRDFQRTNTYARSLLLCIAFSSNIGGMMSPISSPANAIILGYIEDKFPDHIITFFQWITISLPISILCVVCIWLYFYIFLLKDATDVPPTISRILYSPLPMGKQEMTILFITIFSIFLWVTQSSTRAIFGNMSTVALFPILLFFGLGILDKKDLSSFNWQLILLIAGGNVLGIAINSSNLLNIISEFLLPYFTNTDVYVTALIVIIFTFICTSLVSQTVAAIILTPLMVSMGNEVGHTHLIVIMSAFQISATMSLPMTTFPNMNALLFDDDFGRPFLHASDFIRHGSIVSFMLMFIMMTVGYVSVRWGFSKPLDIPGIDTMATGN